ncbi:MAG: hypothetical protein KJ000_31500 [Pirellulaceae bacterium]|nr:hypothetical protein [Pirellulaceae bacterium]
MTLLGKIFTVLILIMSIVFMSFSVVVFATHKNWKMLVTNPTPTETYGLGLVHQLKRERETNLNLRRELEDLKTQNAIEKAARRHAIGALETKLTSVQQSLTEKEGQLRTLQATESESAAALKIAVDTAEKLRVAVDGLRTEVRATQEARDAKFAEVVRLTDQLQGAMGTQRILQERAQQMVTQISDMKRVIDAAGVDVNMDTNAVPPPLDGIVTAVGESNLIEVSLGSDDGLRVGHRIEVFRDNSYLGHAIVLKTDPDRSVAQMDDKTQRGLIKVRDRVATKINRTRTG